MEPNCQILMMLNYTETLLGLLVSVPRTKIVNFIHMILGKFEFRIS
jgi:hypothetical protein